jgi:nucleoside-diphosphate-sugar epimerase
VSAAKRVLVTGAGGFIGRHSIAPLRHSGYEVHAVLSNRADDTRPAGVTAHRADLLDLGAIDSLIEEVRPTHLLHFAWIATPGIYAHSPLNHRWLAASRHLLRSFAQAGGQRVVMAGSCAEYDWSRVEICSERTSPLADAGSPSTTPYAHCKIELARELDIFCRAHAVSGAWGRLFFQFGPHEHPRRLVASVISDLLMGRAALCTHGRQIRSFLHVADVGAAFAALLDGAIDGAINIGSAERISIGELLLDIARRIGRPELLKLGARPEMPGEPAILVPDVARLRDEVGFTPRLTLGEGLDDAIEWWRRQLEIGH